MSTGGPSPERIVVDGHESQNDQASTWRPPPGLRREQEQSWWLHRAVADKVRAEPDAVLQQAARTLDRLEAIHHGDVARQWLRKWRGVLEGGEQAVMSTLLGSTDLDVEMRRNSPFAAVLSEQERHQVLTEFGKHWRARTLSSGPR